MKIDENTIIKCKNIEEVKDCSNSLHELGFKTDFQDDKDFNFIAWSVNDVFCNFETVEVTKDINFISYKYFLKLYNKQIKKSKQPDLLVDKNGKVLKINNLDSNQIIYYYDYNKINQTRICYTIKEFLNFNLSVMDVYVTQEACEKIIKRKQIEKKLELLAFELNGNRDIDWGKGEPKYYLYYNIPNKVIDTGWNSYNKQQGGIYCLSENFKNRAIELIGEEDLKDYLINY